MIRLLLVNLLYRKINSLSNYSVKKANVGKIINLVSNDLNIAEFKIMLLIPMVCLPFLIIFGGIVVYLRHGYWGLILIALILLILPFQMIYMKLSSKNLGLKH